MKNPIRRTVRGVALALALGLLPAAAQAQDAPRLSDAEIAHVAVTANAIDVHMGQVAQSRADHRDVKAFANTMITDHTAVNERAARLADRLGVTPADNDVSKALHAHAQQDLPRLEGLSGHAFDRAYMEREVAFHAHVLEALDQVLIPQTRNHDLRALLTEVRPAIAAHLEHARHIAASLNDRR